MAQGDFTLHFNGLDWGGLLSPADLDRSVYAYAGELRSSDVASQAELLKTRLAERAVPPKVVRKIFSAFVEMSQNVLHYSAPIKGEEPDHKVGSFAAGLREGEYWLAALNPVAPEMVPRLQSKLESLKGLSLDEIKKAYKEQLNNTEHESTDPDSKGAGLGFLTIARDSGEPLEYAFAPTKDGACMSFGLRATFRDQPRA